MIKKRVLKYSLLHRVSTFFLITLLLLNVGLPYAFADQLQKKHFSSKQIDFPFSSEDSDNPLEEKVESKKFSEDFLHDFSMYSLIYFENASYFNGRSSDLYHAFHGELLIPPPNFSFSI